VIKFHGTASDGGELIGIGLSRKNCERLLAGKPIHFKLSDMAASGLAMKGEVLIIGGETEEAITAELHQLGALENARVFGFDETKEQR
jgi:hypothetical protein